MHRHCCKGLSQAIDGCLNGEYAALVTAPLAKRVIADSGIAFSGHTEFLAEKTGTPLPVMLLVAGDLRVALATTHLPLRDVPDAVTAERLTAVLRVLQSDLTTKFGIASPRIVVCGLNPHAGEGGHLGAEDDAVIAPVIQALNAEGFDLLGPLPADTAFTPAAGDHDAVLAMYHDQGLPVLKYAGFGNAVNVTLGLPMIRTSVDHGTAFDIAGTGKADSGSLIAAVELAAAMAASAVTQHRARKRFGQHFLSDPAVIGRIVDTVHATADDVVVEIGPGRGAITGLLAERAGHLHLVELDRDLVAELRQRFDANDRITVHEADALKFDFGALGERLRVVGNLPYNISTPLLFHLLEVREHIADMHFMLQKEVVDRMAAGSRGAKPTAASVSCWVPSCRSRRCFDVPPDAFEPPPSVLSSAGETGSVAAGTFDIKDADLMSRLVVHCLQPAPQNHPQCSLRSEVVTPRRCRPLASIRSQRAEQIEIAAYVALANHVAGRLG